MPLYIGFSKIPKTEIDSAWYRSPKLSRLMLKMHKCLIHVNININWFSPRDVRIFLYSQAADLDY